MRLAGHGKKVLSLAIAAAMAVSVCTTGWAETVAPGAATDSPGSYGEATGDGEGNVPGIAKQQNQNPGKDDAAGEQKQQQTPDAAGAGDAANGQLTAVLSEEGEPSSPVKIGEQEYGSLNAALNAVAAGGTATIDFTGDVYEEDQIKFDDNKTITLNLNGYTLHATRGAGSSGTETSGMQLINGCNVTINNGTLTSEVALNGWMIKNYCNLTMNNVTVNSSQFSSGGINHCGATLKLNNCTMNDVRAGAYAVQCGNYHTGDTVTVIDGGTYSGVANETGYWDSNGGNVQNDIITTIRNATVNKVGTVPYNPFYDKSVMTVESSAKVGSVEGYTAKIEAEGAVNYYASVNAAVLNAPAAATVQLLQDTEEDVVIPEGKTITLDLNGKTLTNVSDHTITNNGTLTVTGEGTVDNITHTKGALVNNGIATIQGGTFTRSMEAGTDDGANDNSWYVIRNLGTITFAEGASVTVNGTFSSMICNGRASNEEGGRAEGVMTILGGNFSGGLNAVKNTAGTVTVKGGTLKANANGQAAIKNSSEATVVVEGGDISSENYVALYNYGIAEVKGGTLTTKSDKPAVENCTVYVIDGNGPSQDRNEYATEGKLTISGGTFASAGEYSVYSWVDSNGNWGYVGPEVSISGGSYDGVVYCANGNMTITDGTFADSVKIERNNNGTGSIWKITPALTIEGGTFGAPVVGTGVVNVTISGGKFSDAGTGSCMNVANASSTVNVSGGYFTTKVDSNYIKEDNLACNLLDSLYEGKYAYQVGEKVEGVAQDVVLQPEAPDTSAIEMSSSSIPDVDGVDKEQLAEDISTTAEKIAVTEESQAAVSNAALVEAKIDGYKVNSENAKKIATDALQKELSEGDNLKDGGDITITVTPVLKIEPKAPVEKDGKLVGVSFDIKLMYKVTASAKTKQGETVTAELGKETAVSNPPVMQMTIPGIPAKALNYDADEIDPQTNNSLYVRHEHGNSVYYYTTEVTEDAGASTVSVTFTNRHGFSLMTVINDTTEVQVKYPMLSDPQTYKVTSVGGSLPAPQKDDSTFNGWTFAGVSGGPYKVMTEDLLTALAKAYADNGNSPVVATASYTDNTVGGNTTTENNAASTATTTQSGGNITYYTCPACGYHNWTATGEGYKCDHCGYVESVKQLSGYGNVKGIYEPKTSAAAAQSASGAASAAATSAIPQTSDELPLVGLVVVAIAALLGLGITIVLKKRNNR